MRFNCYYKKFIKHYGLLAAPLTSFLKKDAFIWNSTTEEAFQNLKALMTQLPVLALPNFTQEFIIEWDASGNGIGAVLMQGNRLIAYLSQALKGRNLSLYTYEKELLALVVAVKKCRPYLIDSTFVKKRGHHSLKYLLE